MTDEQARRGALEAIERILNRGGDADDVLRQVLDVVAGLWGHAALFFVEEGELVTGPAAGDATGALREYDVLFEHAKVAELRVAARPDDDELLARVATLISPYALVGWDTGGEAWEP